MISINKNIFVAFLFSCIYGCTNEMNISEHNNIYKINPKELFINIETFRQYGNIADMNNSLKTRSSSSNEFEETKEVESHESVILPSLASHIWLGNIIGKQSAINADYKPLAYNIAPIYVTCPMPPNYPTGIINTPSNQSMHRFIKETVLPYASFEQNEEFKFSISQFTSYNELKESFGNNVNTSVLFWGSSSNESVTSQEISKATGFYVKFYQTSFTLSMDYPKGSIALDLNQQDRDSAIYINSISFGRLGILTLETNTHSREAKQKLNSSFNTIFTSGNSYLTKEEREFLDGCDFKLFLISGNGKTSVESFHGYAGFIDHISKGKFSKNQPGRPIYCTFNYVKDNSPFKAIFKYSIKKEPLYVEMIRENKKKGSEKFFDIRLNFYRSPSKKPTIASPEIKFKFKIEERFSDGVDLNKIPFTTTYKEYMNTTENISIPTLKDLSDWDFVSDGIGDTFWISFHELRVTLEDGIGYKILGGRTAKTCRIK